jgi:TetR/AcrR family acrAB operon transcriptional repressor
MSDAVPSTRERLLEAALVTFGRRGFEATRVEDVCQTAGIARATFYRHFGGKDDVLAALVDQLVSELDAMAAEISPVTADLAGRAVLRRLVTANLAIAERWAPIVPVLSLPGTGSSPARDRTIASITAASRRVGEAFRDGGAGASDPFLAALAVTGLTDGFGHQVRTWDLALDRDAVVDSLTALAFRMLHPEAVLPAG